MRLRPILAFLAMAVALAGRAAAQDPAGKPGVTTAAPATPVWTLGATKPDLQDTITAWFDRVAVDGALPEVTIGTPSDAAIWLRSASQTCGDPPPSARVKSDASDAARLYVCVRPRKTGQLRLVASVSKQETPVISDVIDVVPHDWLSLSQTTVTILTTASAFVIGLLTTFFTTKIQQSIEEKNREKKLLGEVRSNIETMLDREIAVIVRDLSRFLNENTLPPSLAKPAYMGPQVMGDTVWGYLRQDERRVYLAWLKDLYETRMSAYDDALEQWQHAPEAEKANHLPALRERAQHILATLRP